MAGDPNGRGVPDIRVVISRLTDDELRDAGAGYHTPSSEWDSETAAAADPPPKDEDDVTDRPMKLELYHNGDLVGECTAEVHEMTVRFRLAQPCIAPLPARTAHSVWPHPMPLGWCVRSPPAPPPFSPSVVGGIVRLLTRA